MPLRVIAGRFSPDLWQRLRVWVGYSNMSYTLKGHWGQRTDPGRHSLEFPLPRFSILWCNSRTYQISAPGIPTSLFFFLVFPLQVLQNAVWLLRGFQNSDTSYQSQTCLSYLEVSRQAPLPNRGSFPRLKHVIHHCMEPCTLEKKISWDSSPH